MSPPDTNIRKQTRRHKPALWGIFGALIFAAALFLGLLTWLAYNGQEPRTPETRIDGRTGEPIETD